MRATQRIATGDWRSEPILETQDVPLLQGVLDYFVAGLTAVKTDNLTAAQEALTQLKERKEGFTARPRTREVAVHVMEKELEALVSLAKGDRQQAVALMREATDLEDSMNLRSGPPDPVKPSHELFGEILLELDRPEEAAEQFELGLARAPNRSVLLLGLAQAAARSGNHEKARRTYAQLEKNWRGADAKLPELQELSASRGFQ
jgi:tetratricopeptide (TPR) repeat protein